jgi:radical SAM protein with 4Fe4S-binding SPASM domain
MKQFKRIYIEITNVCNLSCSFCPKTKRHPEFMGLDTFRNILDQIQPYTDHVYFHVKGEPLLHPDIDRFLDISAEKGLQVNITTNGTLIHKVKDKLLGRPALRQINFSLHSFDGNARLASKTEYIGNIFSFVREAREKSEILIAFRLWNLERSSSANMQNKRNLAILEAVEKEFELPYSIQEKVLSGRGMKIADKVYLNQDFEFQWPDLQTEEDDGIGFCYGLRNQIAILADGTVVPCCLDGEGVMDLGNIKTDPFSELLGSLRIKNIIDGFTRMQAVEELCRKCGYRKRFSAASR